MPEMSWKDAISRVLEEEGGPVHYADIAQAIIDRGFKSGVGATPAATVAATISMQMQGQLIRTSRGYYALKSLATPATNIRSQVVPGDVSDPVAQESAEMGLINAFGMFWRRSEVHWTNRGARLLGAQQSGSLEVDFSEQAGVYLLYDADRVIYVGRVTEPRLGARLWEHTRDRLTGRWDRFSWFGVRAVMDTGTLSPVPTAGIEVSTLIATMEALLIEGLEPPQNRRQGDGFNAMEFIQRMDPEVALARKRSLLAELSQGLA